MTDLFKDLLRMLSDWPMGTIVGTFLLFIILALIVAVVMGIGYFPVGKTDHHDHGVIDSKFYAPDTQRTSVAPTVTGQGGGATVVSTGVPESWNVIIKDSKGHLWVFNSKKAFSKAVPGAFVKLRIVETRHLFLHEPSFELEGVEFP